MILNRRTFLKHLIISGLTIPYIPKVFYSIPKEIVLPQSEWWASVNGTWYIMINGEAVDVAITSGDNAESIITKLITVINSNSNLPVMASPVPLVTISSVPPALEVKSGQIGSKIWLYKPDPHLIKEEKENL